MSHLTLRLLGPPEVLHDGQPSTFRTRKTLLLLAYLATESQRHRRDALSALFWPESDPDHARSLFRRTLSNLRDTLGEAATDQPHLHIDGETLTLRPVSVDLDLTAVQAASTVDTLQVAANLIRSDFLDGIVVDDAPDLADWLAAQRLVWRGERDAVFNRLTRFLLDRGALEAAHASAARWVSFDRLNESAARRLMEAHLARGHPEAARAVFEHLQIALQSSLGAIPDPATRALAERIQRHQPPAQSKEQHLNPPLVGREAPLAAVIARFHAAEQGHANTVILEGEAGIGKSRLAADLLAWAASAGADVLAGRAFETGGRLPFAPLADALRTRLA